MKKITSFVAVFVLCLALVFAFASCADDEPISPHDEIVQYDENEMAEFIKNFNTDHLCDDGKISIILTDEANYYIDEYTIDDFSQIDLVSVKAVGKIFLSLQLSDISRENTLRAVYLLQLRSDVKYAEPNRYMDPN